MEQIRLLDVIISSDALVLEKLEEWFDAYFSVNDKCIIAGDKKVNLINDSNFYSCRLKELIEIFGLD